MAGSTRAYTAGKYLLELEGQVGGFLRAVEGGEAFASVIEEAPADTAVNVVRKHLGAMAYAPIQMSVGSGMSNPFYQWMMDWLAGKRIAMSGAIVFLDYNFTEKSRLEFKNAMIVEVGFPALDVASKEFLFFKVTLAPESTRFSQAAAGAGKLSFGAKVKVLKAANFRLKINGVPVTRVNKIDALTVQQGLGAGEAGRMQVPNLAFTVPASDATEWFTWFDDFAIDRPSPLGAR